MMACMFNKGENCIAAGRLFVEASIHDEFVYRVVCYNNYYDSWQLEFTDNLDLYGFGGVTK